MANPTPMTDTAAMISDAFIATVNGLSAEVSRWPRRVPGRLIIGGKVIKYADLHSFYYQARQIFGEHIYGFAATQPAPVILDCGAHVGLSSIYFKERYPLARITAFEADATIAGLCRDNLAACGFTDIAVEAKAVWTHGDGVTFSASQDDAGHVAASGEVSVPSVRLKDVLSNTKVDLLKLDIEGAEFDVLADCAASLANVHRMIIEVHAFGAHAKVGAAMAVLEAAGFKFSIADLHHATWMQPHDTPPFAAVRTDKYYFTIFAWR